ncbi:MAG: hypothetical protein IPN33_11965 [Saprospiraceae bacterium]|nr:hypothetical protein [Saprospiraceae bacterium]
MADISGSNGFESDNDGTGTTNTPLTDPKFVNLSIFGPKQTANTTINSNFRRGCTFAAVLRTISTTRLS